MQNTKLENLEAIALIVLVMTNKIILNLPKTILSTTGTSAWLNTIYISIITLLVVIIILSLFKNFPGYDILDVTNYLGGKILKTVIGSLYIIFFLANAVLILRSFSESIKIIFADEFGFCLGVSHSQIPFVHEFNLDDISLKILTLLQENARMTYTEIGQKIKMASTSVKERVQKMEDVGIIKKYTVELDNEKLGYPINAIITLSCAGAYTPKEQVIVDMLSEYRQVLEVLRISGKNDFLIKVCVKSMDEYKEINDKLGKFGQIETSFVVTSFINNTSIDLSKK